MMHTYTPGDRVWYQPGPEAPPFECSVLEVHGATHCLVKCPSGAERMAPVTKLMPTKG